MLQQIEKKTSKVPVSGTIERVNEKGIKVNGEWFNFSKFMSTIPTLHEGDLIEFKSSKNFINEVSKVTPANGSAKSAAAAPKAPEVKETPKNEGKADGPDPSSAPPSPKDPPRKEILAADSGRAESDREELLRCLKDAVQITEQVDSARFSTQDIIKLALTLFIHRTA
ncbi:MAG: hypothetical protein M1395_00750 [Bacteroidetes bacterium]|nr:hypothetical protein [Bacteroidota bacterium]